MVIVFISLMRISDKQQAKPFLKWAGGKTQLLPAIDSFLPDGFAAEEDVTYIEPFVGGGAVLFHLLHKYPNVTKAYINDINPGLINAYRVVKENPHELINCLSDLEERFKSLTCGELQKDFFLRIREEYNHSSLAMVEKASYLIFLNRTCFNGLYRENSKGEFNVPFGRYVNPKICDSELIIADSELLQKVEICAGDFAGVDKFIGTYTFVYFDPPYRPLDATSSFNSYVKERFDDSEQIRLKEFFEALSLKGCLCMLSNSDGKSRDIQNDFMDVLYDKFCIERVYAKRRINSNASKRGLIPELLIRNYKDCQGIC